MGREDARSRLTSVTQCNNVIAKFTRKDQGLFLMIECRRTFWGLFLAVHSVYPC